MDVFAMMDMLAMASLVTKSNIAKVKIGNLYNTDMHTMYSFDVTTKLKKIF